MTPFERDMRLLEHREFGPRVLLADRQWPDLDTGAPASEIASGNAPAKPPIVVAESS